MNNKSKYSGSSIAIPDADRSRLNAPGVVAIISKNKIRFRYSEFCRPSKGKAEARRKARAHGDAWVAVMFEARTNRGDDVAMTQDQPIGAPGPRP